jgi:hypothetical protein
MYNEELKKSVKETIISLAVKRSKDGLSHKFMAKKLTELLRNQPDLPQTDLNLVLKELHNEKFLQGKYATEPFELLGYIVVSVPQRDLSEHEKTWLHCLDEGCGRCQDTFRLISSFTKINLAS